MTLRLPLLLALSSLALAGCGGSDGVFVAPDEDTGAVADDTGGTPADTGTAGDGATSDGTTSDSGAGDATTDGTSTDTGASGDGATDAPATDSGAVDSGTVTDSGTVVDAVTDAPLACTEPGAKIYNGHCYFRLETARNWAAAEAACVAAGGNTHLVAITTDGEQSFVQTNFASGVGVADRWIGLSRKPTDPNTKASFKWSTGETSTFDNWNVGEPNGSGACARIVAGVVGGGKWADRSCDQLMQPICERAP